ncbi:cytochrome b [Sphingobium sp. HWE2-09]|uniref:cytochrome b n=1 Tax=Sphingobium sp. HWE2-09 TaxID=3108390 RepID=UPI002DCC4F09|nr:cytochrome b/b6 domain-containing protein [Sphingobium sp. HWE2-09]
MATSAEADRPHEGDGARYTRVAMWLHWAIAILIIYNLVSGLLIWDLAKGFFKANRALYGFGLTSHLSSGMTVLALTVVRIVWRLMHEPPAYPHDMKLWERHASHFAHFLLYAGMVLMPLTGWAILSAHPPAGSPGAAVARIPMAAASPMAPGPAGSAPGARPDGPPPGARMPGPPGIWWTIPLPSITPIANIGIEPGGVEPQHILHEELALWHKIGGYLMILLLLGHVGGALKHQFIDKEPELQRMGWRKRKSRVQ